MAAAAVDMAEQRARFVAHQTVYNEERPHEALGQRTPAQVYEKSPRRPPARRPEPDYPADTERRRVRPNGEIKRGGSTVYVSDVLAGEEVGLARAAAGEAVIYYRELIGVIPQGSDRLRRPTLAEQIAHQAHLSPIQPG